MRHVVVAACVAAAGVIGGCGGGGRMTVEDVSVIEPGSAGYSPAGATTVSASTGGGHGRQEPYVEAYASGKFGLAKSLAEAELRRSEGERAERPTLIAGLAAHALNDNAEADRLLGRITSSRDPEISGRAEAALGLIAAEQKQHEKAAGLLISAARKLSGDEGARAAMKAGDSLMALRRQPQAKTQYTLAATMAHSPDLKKAVADRLESGNYTVQVGVFNARANAQTAARDIAGAADALGLQPRIIERTDDKGRPSFVVQVGRFTSRQQAQAAKSRLGTGWMVALGPNE